MKKKLISMLLVLVMLLSLMPTMAFAAGETSQTLTGSFYGMQNIPETGKLSFDSIVTSSHLVPKTDAALWVFCPSSTNTSTGKIFTKLGNGSYYYLGVSNGKLTLVSGTSEIESHSSHLDKTNAPKGAADFTITLDEKNYPGRAYLSCKSNSTTYYLSITDTGASLSTKQSFVFLRGNTGESYMKGFNQKNGTSALEDSEQRQIYILNSDKNKALSVAGNAISTAAYDDNNNNRVKTYFAMPATPDEIAMPLVEDNGVIFKLGNAEVWSFSGNAKEFSLSATSQSGMMVTSSTSSSGGFHYFYLKLSDGKTARSNNNNNTLWQVITASEASGANSVDALKCSYKQDSNGFTFNKHDTNRFGFGDTSNTGTYHSIGIYKKFDTTCSVTNVTHDADGSVYLPVTTTPTVVNFERTVIDGSTSKTVKTTVAPVVKYSMDGENWYTAAEAATVDGFPKDAGTYTVYVAMFYTSDNAEYYQLLGKPVAATVKLNQIINHTVSVSVENGTAAPTTASATVRDGQGYSVSFTPNEGYVLDYVLVDNAAANLTNNGYTFSNVTADHSIKVVYAEDKIGDKPDDSNYPNVPDGIPVCHQALVTYTIDGGTWDGQSDTAAKYHVFTLEQKNAAGAWSAISPAPTLGTTLPTGMKPSDANKAKAGHWYVGTEKTAVSSETPVTATITYKWSYNEDLTAAKTVTSTAPDVGQEMTFKITLKNNTTEAITNVKVVEAAGNIITEATENPKNEYTVASVPAGETVTLNVKHTVTYDDIKAGKFTNTATVTYGDTEINLTKDGSTKEVRTTFETKKEITNKPQNGSFKLGETINYTISVKNTGNLPYEDLTVKEIEGMVITENEAYALNADKTEAVFKDAVGAGETVYVNVTHEVTEADVRAGKVVNTATVSAKDPKNPSNPSITPKDQPKNELPNLDSKVYTIEYYYDETKGEAPTGAAVDGIAALGSTTKVTAEPTLTVGTKNYALDTIKQATISATASENVVKVYYAEDKIAGDPNDLSNPSKPNNPNGPDGIPDCYQALVTYTIVGGTWDGQSDSADRYYVFTLREKSSGEWQAISPAPTLGTSVPTDMKPAEGYSNNGSWGTGDSVPLSTTAPNANKTYTYTFVAVNGITYPDKLTGNQPTYTTQNPAVEHGKTVKILLDGGAFAEAPTGWTPEEGETPTYYTKTITSADESLVGNYPTKSGNVFDGWKVLTLGDDGFDGSCALTLKAKWEPDVIDEKNPDVPGPDNTPDKYQKTVTFKIEDGEWADVGNGNPVSAVVTLFDAQGNWDENGTGTLADVAIPVPATVDDFTGSWIKTVGIRCTAETPVASSKIKADTTYTYSYVLKVFYHANGGQFNSTNPDVDGQSEYTADCTYMATADMIDIPEKAGFGTWITVSNNDTNKQFAGWYLDEDLTKSWNFNDSVTKTIDLYAKWVDELYTVTVNVTGGTVDGAAVTLRVGEDVKDTGAVSGGACIFTGVPAGNYTITVEKDDSDPADKIIDRSATVAISVDGDETVDVALPTDAVTVEMDDSKAKHDTSAEGLMEMAKETKNLPGAGEKVDIEMDVEEVDNETVKEILQKAPETLSTYVEFAIEAIDQTITSEGMGGTVEYMNIDITRTVTPTSGEVTSTLINETANLIKLTIAFPTAGKDINIYRFHDADAETPYSHDNANAGGIKLRQITDMSDAEDGTYFVDYENNCIYIFSRYFSYYAIEYRDHVTPSPAPSGVTTYKVNAPEKTKNGQVTISKSRASAGETVTVTTVPDKGYRATVTVTDKDGNIITLTDNGSGVFTFKMPAKDVWVNVKFICLRDQYCPIEPFDDTKNDYWWHDGVHFCIEETYMVGFPDGSFQPNGTTTRAQIACIFWRIAGCPTVDYEITFKDVKPHAWYTEAIRWAEATGVVFGYSADYYGPNDPVTREQLAAIIYRYAQGLGEGFTGTWMFLLDYTDRASIGKWAYESACWCSMKDIVVGDNGTYKPKANATRAEAACMIQRFCETILGM